MRESKMLRQGGGIQTSVVVSGHFYELCKRYHIKFSEALREGISLMLAERGEGEYNNNLNLFRRMRKIQLLLEEKSNELEEIKEKVNGDLGIATPPTPPQGGAE